MRSLFSSRSKRADDQAFDSISDISADPSERLLADMPSNALEATIAASPAQQAAQLQDEEIVVTLSRGDTTSQQGLGLVFDSNFAVSKLLPGCAAEANGQIQVGDILLAVDNVELQAGDSVRALFPVSEATFNLRLLRPDPATLNRAFSMTPPSASGSRSGEAAAALTRSLSQMGVKRELAGKYNPSRPGPVFQEVLWNEYCVLFPDGSSSPFDDKVRYTALTGYLRKKPIVRAGRAEFAISHGESQRDWARHFFHLSMKQLAWFDQDPNLVLERKRIANADASLTAQMKEASRSVKASTSRGKGVGSALLYAAPCRLYVSRLLPNEFALSYGEGSLLVMQAATGADAQQWLVSLASCLFFSSAAFEAVLAECAAFFEAAPKTLAGKLSPIEALDTLRAMSRPCTYTQVIDAAAEVNADGGWLGVREFTHLVRSVCRDSDPRAELLRAFRVLEGRDAPDTRDTREAAAADDLDAAADDLDGAAAPENPDASASISVAELKETLEAAGIPNEHSIANSAATRAAATPRTVEARVNERLNRAITSNRRRPQPTLADAAGLPTTGASGKALHAMLSPRAPLPPGVPPNTSTLYRG